MLRLRKSTVEAILSWASRHHEVEVCGLVWGHSESDRGETVYPLRNMHPDPARYYRTSPKDIREAFDAMDREDGYPLAWYHSHPSGKPDPSETDMQGAFDTDMYYLIAYPHTWEVVSGQATEWQLSVWECLEPGLLVGVDYEVIS